MPRKQYFLDKTGLIHIGTQSHCFIAQKTFSGLSQNEIPAVRRGSRQVVLPHNQKGTYILYLLVKGKFSFIQRSDPGHIKCTPRQVSCSGVIGQQKMDSLFFMHFFVVVIMRETVGKTEREREREDKVRWVGRENM